MKIDFYSGFSIFKKYEKRKQGKKYVNLFEKIEYIIHLKYDCKKFLYNLIFDIFFSTASNKRPTLL